MKTINTFDIDGVITVGLYPGPDDVIITGRSYEEAPETYAMLRSKGINNPVYFNPLPFDKKTRKVQVSIKALEMAEEKEAMAQYGSADSGATLGDILGAALKKGK